MILIVFVFNIIYNYSTKLNPDFVHSLDDINWTLIVWPTFDEESYINLFTWSKLDIQVYDLTSPDFINLIIDFRKNLWNVRLMLEDNKYKSTNTYKKVANKLFKYWVEMKTDKKIWTNYLHSKIILTDRLFVIQSGNLWYSTFYKNREHFFVSDNKDILKNLNHIFEKDWNWSKLKAWDIHPNLIICNINCRDKIQLLLSNAERSIHIQTQYLSDVWILKILEAKSHLDLKILVGEWQDRLFYEWSIVGKNIKIFNKYYLHTKSILIDDKYLIIWSMNLSDNSLDNNREHWIILINWNLINQYKKQFFKDWELTK